MKIKLSILLLAVLVSLPLHAAVSDTYKNTALKAIIGSDDSLESIRQTAAGKTVLSTDLILRETVKNTATGATLEYTEASVKQSFDSKLNAYYAEFSQVETGVLIKMIERKVKGKTEKYIYMNEKYVSAMSTSLGSNAYKNYADKWVVVEDETLTIKNFLSFVTSENLIFKLASTPAKSLGVVTSSKENSATILTLAMLVPNGTPIGVGTLKYQQITPLGNVRISYILNSDNKTYEAQLTHNRWTKKTNFSLPNDRYYISKTNIDKEVEVDSKGVLFNLQQSGLQMGNTLPSGYTYCASDMYSPSSIFCIENKNIPTTAINIFGWTSGTTKKDIESIKTDADAKRVIRSWFSPNDYSRTYKDAYTKTVGGRFFVIKEEQAPTNGKIRYFVTAYTILDGKLFKVEVSTTDLKSSISRRADLNFFLENTFNYNTGTASVITPKAPTDINSLMKASSDRLTAKKMWGVGVWSLPDPQTPFVVGARDGFRFDDNRKYNTGVQLKSTTAGKETQIDISSMGKIALGQGTEKPLYAKTVDELRSQRVATFPNSVASNFNVFKRNGYTFASYDERNGLYAYNRTLYITRENFNSSDPFFIVYIGSNAPIDETVVNEFVEAFGF